MNLVCRWVLGVCAGVLLGGAAGSASAATAASVAGPESITYLTEDYPPSNYVEDGKLKGYAVDLLRALWKQMGVAEQPIEVTNWARAFNRLETTPNTMLFAMSRNAERVAKFQWVGPIYQNRYVLVGLARRDFAIQSTADAARYRVGVIREDVGHKLLLEAGLADARLEKVSDFRQLVKMLAADRIDLLCVSNTLIPQFAQQSSLKPADVKPVHVVRESEIYYALHKDSDPALVKRFQTTLKALEPERRRILKNYGLE